MDILVQFNITKSDDQRSNSYLIWQFDHCGIMKINI